MVHRYLPVVLMMLIIWMWLPPAWAGDVPKAPPTAQSPNREELDMIAVMEILQTMDLVEAMDIMEDLDVLTKEEPDDKHD